MIYSLVLALAQASEPQLSKSTWVSVVGVIMILVLVVLMLLQDSPDRPEK